MKCNNFRIYDSKNNKCIIFSVDIRPEGESGYKSLSIRLYESGYHMMEISGVGGKSERYILEGQSNFQKILELFNGKIENGLVKWYDFNIKDKAQVILKSLRLEYLMGNIKFKNKESDKYTTYVYFLSMSE